MNEEQKKIYTNIEKKILAIRDKYYPGIRVECSEPSWRVIPDGEFRIEISVWPPILIDDSEPIRRSAPQVEHAVGMAVCFMYFAELFEARAMRNRGKEVLINDDPEKRTLEDNALEAAYRRGDIPKHRLRRKREYVEENRQCPLTRKVLAIRDKLYPGYLVKVGKPYLPGLIRHHGSHDLFESVLIRAWRPDKDFRDNADGAAHGFVSRLEETALKVLEKAKWNDRY